MAFDQRHHDRFPIFAPVSYEVLDRAGFRKGYGTVTNLSVHGWKISGNMGLHAGEVCSMEIRLASKKWALISTGIVRWTRGEVSGAFGEAGIETLVMTDTATRQLNEYIQKHRRNG